MTRSDAAGLFQIVWIGMESRARTLDASFRLDSVVDRSAAESWFQWHARNINLDEPGQLRLAANALKERLLAEWLEQYQQ